MKRRVVVILLACCMLLSIVPDAYAARSTAEVVEAALQLLYYNEGSYGSVNANDNGAVSIGKIQWHGNRALNLLKTIVNMNQSQAKSILGDALYNEILTSTNWSTRTVNETEKSAISKLLTTSEGESAQDALATTDVTGYVNHGKNLGITDDAALVYFADLENQGGAGMSGRVAGNAASAVGAYANITLTSLHNAALADSVAGKYASRRNRTLAYCQGLGWSEDNHECNKGTYKYYWDAHPHYKCYQCSRCGKINEFRDETVPLNTCDKCRPGKAVLEVDVNDDCVATFTWGETANTTHYNVWLHKKAEDGSWETIKQFYEANSGFTCTLDEGEYRAQLLSYNSEMWEPDNSDWVHTWAEDVYFSASDECRHNYTSTRIEPTCTELGYTIHTCIKCGDSYRDDHTEPKGHSFEDGVCIECGTDDPDTLMAGDLDGDGNVTSADAVMLARYLVDLVELTDAQICAADVNHDGEVTSGDGVLVARYLAGVIEEL